MKTVGIIGGLGPETTAKFYLEIIFACSKVSKKRPSVLLWSIPIPFKIERNLLTKNKGQEKFLPFLIEAAKTLESAGADFLVIPCNTVHIFISQIRKAVKIPVLSIVEETANVIDAMAIEEVGILGTSTTIKSRLFQNTLNPRGIKTETPSAKNQSKLNKIIHNLVSERQTQRDNKKFIGIINSLKNKNVKAIVLACTDLQLIKTSQKIKTIDTMKVLANATVREIMKGGDKTWQLKVTEAHSNLRQEMDSLRMEQKLRRSLK